MAPATDCLACEIWATGIAFLSLRPCCEADQCRALPLCPTRSPETHRGATSPVVEAHWSRCLIHPPPSPCTNRPGRRGCCPARHDEKGRSLSAPSTPRANHGALHFTTQPHHALLGGCPIRAGD
ncbi:hypothetical protein F5144DRAFT_291922 [Chaetomium tenue]|uniref:Uncharacterized protein n=1 Tax=Chaetomium tenue TaxID=1854479 RepID=A0ACB7P4B4_9PEZI|nr:hypothetical protein F5144DRAFT_291922 [Chaetomium globosum]